jgi:hypothetical protein
MARPEVPFSEGAEGSGQFRRLVVARRTPDGGLQLHVFGRIAAGGQVEVAATQACAVSAEIFDEGIEAR